MSDKEFRSQLLKKARVGLSNGILFGTDGEGFQRINMGCPRKILEQGLNQIAGIFR
jgi:cystathionine beta-lyase